MKKIILTLSFVLLSILSYCQNGLGTSVRDVRQLLINDGYIKTEGYTDKGVFYIIGHDNTSLRIFYFNYNNVCELYVFSIKGATYDDYERGLFDNSYVRMGSKYYSEEYVAEIVYDNEYNIYLTKINFKTKKDNYGKTN
jgi:hypothetical protein